LKQYLISSKTHDALFEQLDTYKPDYALYRDKENSNYDTNAKEFIAFCKQASSIKSFLHQKVNLAKDLGATGVHLTSLQFDSIEDAKSKGLEVIISTHTYEEVLQAEKLGADAVTYSPIFASPNKGKPKGLADLHKLLEQTNIKVFALGGIVSQDDIDKIKKSQSYGFASIRYFD